MCPPAACLSVGSGNKALSVNLKSGWAINLWIAAGIEMVGLAGASMCALLSPAMTLSVEGSVDVVGSSFVTVAPTEIEINYVDLPVKLEYGQQVRIVYVDAGAHGWSALFITVKPGSATYVTPDGRDYQQKQEVARFTRAGLLAGLAIAASAAIGAIVLGLRRRAPAVVIATVAAPWTLLGSVPAIINLASLQADRSVENPASLVWLSAVLVTLTASAVGLLRHEPGSRILLGTIALAVATSVAWFAGWISYFSDFSGLVPRAKLVRDVAQMCSYASAAFIHTRFFTGNDATRVAS